MATLVHGTCIELVSVGVLLCGPSGSGKSDLALRLMESGARLVADDQVELNVVQGRLLASSPAPLCGRLEVRGVGIVKVDSARSAALSLVVDLVAPADVERLPDPAQRRYLGINLPRITVSPFEHNAPAKLRLAVSGMSQVDMQQDGDVMNKLTDARASKSNDSTEPGDENERKRVLVVTGMSGAGKTAALKSLEDLGFEAVDNLPLSLLASLVQPSIASSRPLSIGVDIRTRDFGAEPFVHQIDDLIDNSEVDVQLLFLDCGDDVLQRRYSETRRRHPLAADRPLPDGIKHERRLVSPLRDRADVVIDTSNLQLGDLKRILHGHFALDASTGLAVFVTSFSYRRGLPPEADIVLDVRFLANPHYEPSLKALTGKDAPVGAFIAADEGLAGFFEHATKMLEHTLPRYAEEGKSYLTIATGCTGGQHRSVFVAEKLAAWLRALGVRVDITHRDLHLAPPRG